MKAVIIAVDRVAVTNVDPIVAVRNYYLIQRFTMIPHVQSGA